MAEAAERNEATIRKLYAGLDAHDGEAMASCYALEATFSDPVFPELTGAQAGDMWRMLTSRATDLSVELPEAKHYFVEDAPDEVAAAIAARFG